MLKTLEDTLKKSCLVGLTYFDLDGKELKRQLLGGSVISVDNEMGITIELLTTEKPQGKKQANFIIPATLTCWFKAPKGEFHTSHNEVKIINPDYLVTWDIYQTKPQDNKQQNGEQQWWKWYPRIEDPIVNK